MQFPINLVWEENSGLLIKLSSENVIVTDISLTRAILPAALKL